MRFKRCLWRPSSLVSIESLGGLLTDITAQGALRITLSVTDPSIRRSNPLRPCVPSHQTGWTGIIARVLDLFNRSNSADWLQISRGDLAARITREQIAGIRKAG